MERVQLILLVGLPLFLICSDLINIFTPPPYKPPPHGHRDHHHHCYEHLKLETSPLSTLDFPPPPPEKEEVVVEDGGIGIGNTLKISFCSSCSYRGTAMTMKNMLETRFPGIELVLANYPPPFPKRIIATLVPLTQIGVIGIAVIGDHIFPTLGIMAPPPWYHLLRDNKFRTIAASLLFGSALQSYLLSSGAFEVYCNDELVFSKLKEGRFPGEMELKDLVSKRLARSHSGIPNMWGMVA